jgi:hypothetical protein
VKKKSKEGAAIIAAATPAHQSSGDDRDLHPEEQDDGHVGSAEELTKRHSTTK